MERTIVAALVLSAFSLLVLHVLTNPQPPITYEKELFVNASVTRASDCNCLPGYIPSSAGNSYHCVKLGDPRVTRKCY